MLVHGDMHSVCRLN